MAATSTTRTAQAMIRRRKRGKWHNKSKKNPNKHNGGAI
jgi:hypothetical protein